MASTPDRFQRPEASASSPAERTQNAADAPTHGFQRPESECVFLAGPRRLGDFQILREVGRGGMGAVFEAEQISLKRRVALKVMRIESAADPTASERFQREAETIANLHHTNIVPIFAVGRESGVHYYAMQLIEGQSLAEVLSEAQNPLAPHRVAALALQAAEALSHAHQRGVIHRDVKPSNLLLDRNDQLWLTDFGLARHIEDLGLSVSGALLGTPRYMSPEQANLTSGDRIDHRSDLFSLGASLYELLTGRFAFEGETPLAIIQQILQCDPTPIRKIVDTIPRDLETIVMKCLAKEPSQRYASASDLADDLRAFLDDRPIHARRASARELAAQWLRKRKRSVMLSGSGALIALMLVVVATVGWLRYDRWRQASLRLEASHPPIVVEIMNSNGILLKTETAPMQEAVVLPTGNYTVRASSPGTLSQTFHASLRRGTELVSTLDLHDQMLWPPVSLERSFATVDFGNEQGLVLWTDEGIELRKRNSSAASWKTRLVAPTPATLAEFPGFSWPWTSLSHAHSAYGSHDYQPWLAPAAIDIDADGVGDLLVAARHQAWVMAVSGKDGRIIWFAGRGQPLRTPSSATAEFRHLDMGSAVLGDPIIAYDCDRDGVNDIIATMLDLGTNPAVQQDVCSASRWVEAISGKSGATLWRYDLPQKLFELPDGGQVPSDLRWYPASAGHSSGGGSSMFAFRHITRELRRTQRTGRHAYQPTSSALVSVEGKVRVALVAGTHILSIDPRNGEQLGAAIDTGTRAGRSPQWSDVDADGSMDLVMLEEIALPNATDALKARLVVWSWARKQMLWSANLDTRWPQRVTWTGDAPQWPLVTDLNGDGASEIVVPSGGLANRPGWAPNPAETPWGKLTVFAGGTGQCLWERRIPSADRQVDHFLAGPDLNEDGHQELYVATLSGNPLRAWVDALSGADGRTFWTASHVPRFGRDQNAASVLRPPSWWRAGGDGWPQFVVHLVNQQTGDARSSLVSLFSAADGQLSQFGYDIASVQPLDMDRDGTEDLLVHLSKSPMTLDVGGSLHCLRGVPGQPWRQLGEAGEPAADLDGDGVRDLVQSWPDGSLLASSGKSGKPIWRTDALASLEGTAFRAASPARPRNHRDSAESDAGDLDGDRTPDLLAWNLSGNGRKGYPFHAISGRTGQRLWTVTDVSARVIPATFAAEACDLDGDGRAEVCWLAALDYGYSDRSALSSNNVQLWLFVTSGQTGRLKWSRPLSPAYGLKSLRPAPLYFPNVNISLSTADLDGDHVQDVLVPCVSDDDAVQLLALSGINGKLLWSRLTPLQGQSQQLLENWVPPTCCDLDGDGRIEIILVEPAPLAAGDPEFGNREVQVVSLPASGGQPHWIHRSGVPFTRWMSAIAEPADVWRPVVLRGPDGQSRVASYQPGDRGKLVTIDAKGHIQERAVARPTHPVPLAKCDVDGDGVDEVVFVERSTIQISPLDRLDQPLWSRTLGNDLEPRFLDVLPATANRGPVIAIGLDGTDNSVLGLDARSGALLWSCPGPISRDPSNGDFLAPRRMALLTSAENPAPLIYYAYGSVAAVRQAATIAAAPRNPQDTAQLASHVPLARPLTDTVVADERWSRDLPWRVREVQVGDAWRIVGWSLFFASALVLAPAVYLIRVIQCRQLSLRKLMLVPVIAAWFTWALYLPVEENDFDSARGRFAAAVGFAPTVVCAAIMFRWLVRRRWKIVCFWVGASGILAILCGGVSLVLAARHAPLVPEERYDWSGWYTIWMFAAFLTTWLLFVTQAVKFFLAARRRRIDGIELPAGSVR